MIRFAPTEHAGQFTASVGPFRLLITHSRPSITMGDGLAAMMRERGHTVDSMGFLSLAPCESRVDLSRILADAAKDRPRGPDYSAMSREQAGYALAATEMT